MGAAEYVVDQAGADLWQAATMNVKATTAWRSGQRNDPPDPFWQHKASRRRKHWWRIAGDLRGYAAEDVTLVVSDRELFAAAVAEGFSTIDPMDEKE